MNILDSHVHLREIGGIDKLEEIRRRVGLDRMNIVCNIGREMINANPWAFAAKSKYPEKFYVFGGLDHAAHFSDGEISTPPLAEQIDRLTALGADGVKMLENKPTHRKLVDLPIDGPYFAEYFAHLEESGVPAIWHVADPEEFWDPATTPKWAADKGWGYDETHIPKEQLYAEVMNVLERHPNLTIVFSHFFFLSADLPRAERQLDRFPNVHLDLAPGIELLYNLSKHPEITRNFFIRHANRIVFGTDISDHHTIEKGEIRSGIVTRWLETEDAYRLPEGSDYVLGPPEDGIIRGLSLPEDVRLRILRENFERLVGPKPKKLNKELAVEECERIAEEIERLHGVKAEDTDAFKAAKMI